MPRTRSLANPDYKSDLVDRNVRVVRTSNRAVLAQPCNGPGEAAWFPLVHVECSPNSNGSHQLTGPEWLFRQKGWL